MRKSMRLNSHMNGHFHYPPAARLEQVVFHKLAQTSPTALKEFCPCTAFVDTQNGENPRHECPTGKPTQTTKPRDHCSPTPEFKAEIIRLRKAGNSSIERLANALAVPEKL